MGDAWTEALWAAHPQMNDSADFVMYWWDHAAELLTQKNTTLRRFGFVTTNSITQRFQSRTVERFIKGKAPISLLLAIPDHPWTKATRDTASVRIAMTVAAYGNHEGVVLRLLSEAGLDTDSPRLLFREERGRINSDLKIGVDITSAKSLRANEGLCSPGVKLHGDGFIISTNEAAHLGLGRRPGLEKHIRNYRHGRDITNRPRNALVIDLFGLDQDSVIRRFPEVYQHVRVHVKEKTVLRNGKTEYVGRDWNNRATYRDNWWIFGEPRSELRAALSGLKRFVATPVTPKHRMFVMLDDSILPDDALMCFAFDDAYFLGVLQSGIHLAWVKANASSLGVYIGDIRYIKSKCFDPFPFPAATPAQQAAIRLIAEDLDAHRKRVLADHPNLTLTALYNVLATLRAAAAKGENTLADTIAALNPADRRVFDDGLVLILKELHDRLDVAVAAAYGWPANLADEEILHRLVTLNRQRAEAEAKGEVAWLRPDYQIGRFATPSDKKLDLVGGAIGAGAEPATAKTSFPAGDMAQTAAVMHVLADTARPLTPDALSARFRQGRRVLPKVSAVLAALSRMGFVGTPDNGRSYTLRGNA